MATRTTVLGSSFFRGRTLTKKVLAIYEPRFIFTPFSLRGRWSAHPGNNGIAGVTNKQWGSEPLDHW